MPILANANNITELQERAQTHFNKAAAELAQQARLAFRRLRAMTCPQRNSVLLDLAQRLQKNECQQNILTANERDIQAAEKQGLHHSLIDRLRLDIQRINDMAQALYDIAALPDPLGEVLQGKRLDNGIELLQKRVPLGVVFTIYESRPNVTIDVGALCLKSGNCAILRGGKEAWHTNQALFHLFQNALRKADFPVAAIQFVNETDRAFLLALLQQERWIDLVVPRGGEALIAFISQNSRIPVVKHDKGVCNMYIDASAELEQTVRLARNAKLQRPAVCNAIENLIVHKDFPALSELLRRLQESGAQLRVCAQTHTHYPQATLIADSESDAEYASEYLDARLAVKLVDDIATAVDFIYRYGSGHSEAIVARDNNSIRYFQENVDSAAVFVNCSTRFHDGGQMGFGAEVGISTGRLHVRGPMALKDLTTTTFFMNGVGQIR